MTNVQEVWKPIPNYEGFYLISNTGKIYSLKYKKQLKFSDNQRGYWQTSIYDKDGNRKTYKVHRLVALTFIDNPKNYPQINHIDGDKKNNNYQNLEWCDNRHNAIHARTVIGYKNYKRPVKMYLNGVFIKHFTSITEATLITGAKHPRICEVCKGKRKTAGGYEWEYA